MTKIYWVLWGIPSLWFFNLTIEGLRRGGGQTRAHPGRDWEERGTPRGLGGCGSGLPQKNQRPVQEPRKLTRRSPLEEQCKAWCPSQRLHQPRGRCQLEPPFQMRTQLQATQPKFTAFVAGFAPPALPRLSGCRAPASGRRVPASGW